MAKSAGGALGQSLLKRAKQGVEADDFIAAAKSWMGDQPVFGSGVSYMNAVAGAQTYNAANLVSR